MKKLIILSILFIIGCEETLEPQDCAGVAGGTAGLDSCAVCIGGTTNLTACVQDCAEDWGGIAVLDSCDVCDADSSNDCIVDCNGDYGGTAVEDECGVCDDDSSNDCEQDCADAWGGTEVLSGCDNTCSSTAVLDECGVCGGNNTPLTGTCDCAGTPNGDSWESDCGCVDADNSGDDCDDCAGTPNGDSWESDCGCVDADNSGDDCDDCEGIPNGDSWEDNCGTCDNDLSNDCVQDCANVWGGTDTTCYGCTDSNAINYNSSSTIDDGSCINLNNYAQISGCLNAFYSSSSNMTLTPKIVNNSSVTILVTGIILLDGDSSIIFASGINNTVLLPNYYLTYNITIANDPVFFNAGYKIIWQFEYNNSAYQNTYFTNCIGCC